MGLSACYFIDKDHMSHHGALSTESSTLNSKYLDSIKLNTGHLDMEIRDVLIHLSASEWKDTLCGLCIVWPAIFIPHEFHVFLTTHTL